MDLEKSAPAARGDTSRGEGWLVVAVRMPVRIVVLVLVVPVRMVWDALVVAGRFLHEAVFRPLGRASLWVGRAVLVRPFVGLWRYVLVPLGKVLAWLAKVLVVLPSVWSYRHVLTPLGHALLWVYARVLTPVGHAVVWLLGGVGAVLAALGAGVYAGLARLTRYLVVVPAVWLHTRVLAPVGRAVAWCAKGIVRLVTTAVTGVGTVLYRIVRILFVLPALAVWRWILVPVGRVLAVVAREAGEALGHAWRVAGRVSLAVGRFLGTLFRWIFVEPVRWVYRSVLTPVGHVVRDAVLRPAAGAARRAGRAARQALASVRTTVRQARADVRRMLLGEPEGDRSGGRPKAREVRGSRNASRGADALTKS
ncbi:hypothetical protein [Streptomyces griseomycini]|uniref:Uncharacterized protein n=1 Tax=Streptomyces griseomycini TaxID=66895 RepID=A0A7W7PPS7_9ACTN|nr:hypothetical protein [Streptomyces griseomycini]MBB4896808.1 hypothetical protein [Streptomyces griseomycini]GGQ99841.1 hypothetical protein GCM10015536_00160 [Streptomyces griseomycini]